jgi:hypothetical protein
MHTSDSSCREKANVYSLFENGLKCHHVIASAAKQSLSQRKKRMDCFAALAMTLLDCAFPRGYPSSTASAPLTASALSITVRSSEPACTVMFSAKNRASVT